jgi:hypothetical protein
MNEAGCLPVVVMPKSKPKPRIVFRTDHWDLILGLIRIRSEKRFKGVILILRSLILGINPGLIPDQC